MLRLSASAPAVDRKSLDRGSRTGETRPGELAAPLKLTKGEPTDKQEGQRNSACEEAQERDRRHTGDELGTDYRGRAHAETRTHRTGGGQRLALSESGADGLPANRQSAQIFIIVSLRARHRAFHPYRLRRARHACLTTNHHAQQHIQEDQRNGKHQGVNGFIAAPPLERACAVRAVSAKSSTRQ